MKKTVFLILILFISSCVSFGRPIDQEAVARIKKGVTTKDEVISLLGNPDTILNTDGVISFGYTYTIAHPTPEAFIPFVGGFVGGSEVQTQIYQVKFNKKNIVSETTQITSSQLLNATSQGGAPMNNDQVENSSARP